jgi:hypothetical protein
MLSDELAEQLLFLDSDRLEELSRAARQQSLELGMWMDDNDEEHVVPISLVPLGMDPATMGYLHHAMWQLRRALQELGNVIASKPRAAKLLDLSDREVDWFDRYRPDEIRPDSRFCRLDAVFHPEASRRRDQLKFIEPNVVGLGGMCYTIDSIDVLESNVYAEVLPEAEDKKMQAPTDPRELLYREIVDFYRNRLDVEDPVVVFLGSRKGYETDGEDGRLIDWMRQRGMDARFADPRELDLDPRDRMRFDGDVVDVVYRMIELPDLLELEDKGFDLGPIEAGFEQGRITPTILGDLEQKSVFEIFTSRHFSEYFTERQLDVFDKHLLWTRKLEKRECLGPDGDEVELIPYARNHREKLVLKPNRSYGGANVLIGRDTDQEAWDEMIDDASGGREQLVVQKLAPLATSPNYPSSTSTEQPSGDDEVYTIIGGFPSRHGFGVLGRYSQESVVNITRGGGILPVVTDFS